MNKLRLDIALPAARRNCVERPSGIRRLAVVIPIATSLVASSRALAASAIDTAYQPYFVLGGWITALVFLGLGGFISGKAIRNRRMALAAVHWTITEGKVLSADVTRRVSKSEDPIDYFVPQVRYEYEVNGVRRQGDVIRIGLDDMGYMEERQARDHIMAYAVGAVIPVRYDPQDPQNAVLETGQVGVARKLLAGTIFIVLGIAAIGFAVWSASLPTR